jgi:hypothetical protein
MAPKPQAPPQTLSFDEANAPDSSSGAEGKAGQPGFFSSLADSFGVGPRSMAAMQQDESQHPIRSAIEKVVPGASMARGLYGMGKASASELGQAYTAAKQKNPAGVASHLISSIPIAGPAMDEAYEQTDPSTPGESYMSRVGDTLSSPGAMGTLTGAATQIAPMLMGDATSRVTRPASDAITGGLKNAGAGIMNRTAGMLKADFKHGANGGEAYLAGGGKPAMTMGGLARNAEKVRSAAGAKLGNLYDTATASGTGFPIADVQSQLEGPLSAYEAEQEGPGATGASPLIDEYRSRMSRPPSGRTPSPVKGFLMPPREETPLGGTNEFLPQRATNDVTGELIPAARLPQEKITGMGTDLSPTGAGGRIRGVIGRQAEQLGSTAQTVPPRMMRESYVTSGERAPQDFEREAVGPGGLWMRRPDMSASTPPGTPYYTPRDVFGLKKSIADQARWNPAEPVGLNAVRQEQVGGLGGMLTDAIPEAKPLNKIYQGALRLGNRAAERANTGSAPLTQIGRRVFESGIGGLGYMTGHPVAGMVPLLADTVPVKSAMAYGLYQGGRGLGAEVPSLLRPLPAVAGINHKKPD